MRRSPRERRLRPLWIALVLSISSTATADAQSSHYMTGSVGITARPGATTGGPDVQSAGKARINKWNGEIDWSQPLDGVHYVYESDSENVVMERRLETSGQYVNSVRASAEPGRCYRARLDAVTPLAADISRGSSEQCFEDSCPVLLDLDGDGFRLVGTGGGVDFDLDADGSSERIGWTAPGALDGFLCWDRDGNDRIDDGAELFGTATPLLAGGLAANGYLALAELDEEVRGGDADGVLSRNDELFRQLCVWFDLDHDGEADDGEWATLEELRVLEIDLDYRSSWRRDRHGNLFRFRSSARVEHRKTDRPVQSYDVFFATAGADE